MNPPSERRFPRLPLAKAEAGASLGAAGFLEDLIDACVMESYFREPMAERGLLFHDLVAPHLAAHEPAASAAQQRDFLTYRISQANHLRHRGEDRLIACLLPVRSRACNQLQPNATVCNTSGTGGQPFQTIAKHSEK